MIHFTKTHFTRFVLPLIISLFCCFGIQAQSEPVVLKVETQYSLNKVVAELQVSNFEDILGFQLSLNWNPALLEYTGDNSSDNENIPFIQTHVTPGALAMVWTDPFAGVSTLEDGTAIIEVEFQNLTGTTKGDVTISNLPTAIEFVRRVDGNAVVVPYEIEGGVSIEGVFLSGRVFHDVNGNCLQDLDEYENGLSDWKINIDDQIYTFSDSYGFYSVFVELGTHTIAATPPNGLWESCELEQEVTVTEFGQSVINDIAAKVLIECPLLEVNIGAPLIRRCFESRYCVDYCNNGTIGTNDAYIEVVLDEYMTFNSSSLIPSSQEGNKLTFDLGTLEIGECGSFYIKVQVGCDDVVLGQTHCTEAEIFPNDPCDDLLNSKWSGASIHIDGTCDGDNVTFSIQNIGIEAMDDYLYYTVIEDDIIMRDEIAFLLGAGESIAVELPATGSTYVIQTDQVEHHPGNSTPIQSMEGCGTDEFGSFSTGYVLQYNQNDGDDFISIDCQENIGAYDPNDKRGFPIGFGEDHMIEANTMIEYKIRFQNTGTDTAFNVVIRDTLDSDVLDISSLRLGARSHPVDLIQTDNVLAFNFDNIMLPDSNVNEVASHGFINFFIQQKEDNPIGTLIENKAAIYFDFNEPVITNTTQHLIGEDFMEVVTSINTILYPEATINVYPNPFSEQVTFDLEGIEENDIQLFVYNNLGQLVRQENLKDSNFTFNRNSLNGGLYYYELKTPKGIFATGKLILKE